MLLNFELWYRIFLDMTPPSALAEEITGMLHALFEGTAWPAEVIVVDQGANAAIAANAEELTLLGMPVRYVRSAERGRAAGVNRGLEQVRTPFVAVTDDGCFAAPDWVPQMIRHLVAHPGSIVSGRVIAAGEQPVVAVSTGTEFRVQRWPRLRFYGFCGGHFGTSRAVLEKTGLFDEDPCRRTAEDNEYAYRSPRAGVPIVCAPDAVVRHCGWRNAAQRQAQYRDCARSHGGFYGKYLSTGDWFIALRTLIHLARALRRWLRGAVTGDKELALHGRAYAAGLLPGS